MKAIVLEGINQPFQLQEVAQPALAEGNVLVQLKAAALNHRDVWIQQGQYPGLKFPCILGSDGAGVVVEVGDGVDATWLNKEVIINSGLFWGNNPRVPAKNFRILGLPDDGTFAQSISVPASHVYAKPTHLSFEETAAIPLAGLTAYRALCSRAGLVANERVLITGIGGGVALFVLQFAVAMGANVYVTSGSDEKIAKAKALGAIGGVNYKDPEWAKQLSAQVKNDGGTGFDVIIDSAGGEGFAKLIDVAAPGGRIAFYGGTNGLWKDIVPGKVFFKQLSIFGTTMGSAQEFEAMLGLIEEKQLKPIIDAIYPLAEMEKATERMKNAQQFGKIVLRMA